MTVVIISKMNETIPTINNSHMRRVTYYSNHIHVYVLLNNFKQRNKAIVLRNRFLAEFNMSDCHAHGETWYPRICHRDLKILPAVYD